MTGNSDQFQPPRASQYNTTLVWPSGTYETAIVYNPDIAPSNGSSFLGQSALTDWGAAILNVTLSGEDIYTHTLDLSNHPPRAFVRGYSGWTILLSNERNYTSPAGILGLGPEGPLNNGDADNSLLEQLKASGAIASKFCGLHMGSPLLSQPGSMILGGYDQNRVLGEVGIFNVLIATPQEGAQGVLSIGGPQAYLLDVALDVETGPSPFNQSSSISLWYGIYNDDGAIESEHAGGKAGSRLVFISPTLPYMCLPLGICETAAQYLPVIWNASLELYLWDMSDQYSRIVRSPAFMSIVLADNFAKNITIKIPFQLLNLTLTPPLVNNPTPYFPCKPADIFNRFALGRAFLQAAFLGFEYEHSLAYIAQAPGPEMEQSVIRTFHLTDKAITPNAVGTFASSWASSWTVLHDSNSTNHSTSSSTISATSTPSNSATIVTHPTVTPLNHKGLSTGATAGAVVGSVVGAVAIIAAAIVIWRKRKATRQTVTAGAESVLAAPSSNDQLRNIKDYPIFIK